MVRLDAGGAKYVRDWLGPVGEPGLLGLWHGLEHGGEGLWGDHANRPGSVVLVREGDGQIEAFGAGEAKPGVGWLIRQGRPFTLQAPESWLEPVKRQVGKVSRAVVETWVHRGFSRDAAAKPKVKVRRLELRHEGCFEAVVPSWGLRGWGSYGRMIEAGASAFGLFDGEGLASASWVFEEAGGFSGVAVYTVRRFRRLGLGYATAYANIWSEIEGRGRLPIWSTPAENTASLTLAGLLGFEHAADEALIRWPPRVEAGIRG